MSGNTIMEKLEQHPLSAAFPAMAADADIWASSLPITEDELESSAWSGRGVNRDAFVVANIWMSEATPGYYHCRVIGRTDCSATKRPVLACAVGLQMDSLLSHHGFKSSNLIWEKSEHCSSVAVKKHEIVYFLRAGNFIKIGHTKGSPHQRAQELQTGCPFRIQVLAAIPGGLKLEHALHRRFRDLHAHGEWFHAAKSLLQFINESAGVVS